jgi:hypothetical protein
MRVTKELVHLAESLFDKNGGILAFEYIARIYAGMNGMPQRDAIALVDRRWRAMLRHMRRRDHRVLTVTTWHGLKLGLEGIAALTEDRAIKRCVPGAGNGGRAEGFVLATDDRHVLFIAECERLGLVSQGVQRTQLGQLADATVQEIVSEDEAKALLAHQPKRLSVTDLKRIGEVAS